MDISADEASGTGAKQGAGTSKTVTEQPFRQQNIDAIAAYIAGGAKTSGAPGALGIELEHNITRTDGTPVSYSEPGGIQDVLKDLSSQYPDATRDAEGDLLGLARDCEAITLEPAAQIELSAGPFQELSRAKEVFDAFEETLDAALAKVGAKTAIVGYHPSAKATELELIPKVRYEYMNRYLGAIGPFGPCMMRGSASTQVSIDYTGEADCIRKLRVAYALVPILSLICDNSPTFEGVPRPHALMRTKIWKECDPARCGIIPGVMGEGFGYRDYAEFVLDVPAILVPDGQGGWAEDARSFGEIYANRAMGRADVEHALSMVFTDVRLKTYLEIRPADAMPVDYVVAYAALIKGIFYCEESLAKAEKLFAGVSEADIAAAKEALMKDGYAARVYGHDAAELADEVAALASAGLDEDDAAYLKPLAQLIKLRKTLAE